MDMTPSDAAETIGHVYNNHVNSTNNNTYYYFTIQNGNTSQYFILCRIAEDIYKPRVKMRVRGQDDDKTYFRSAAYMYEDYIRIAFRCVRELRQHEHEHASAKDLKQSRHGSCYACHLHYHAWLYEKEQQRVDQVKQPRPFSQCGGPCAAHMQRPKQEITKELG